MGKKALDLSVALATYNEQDNLRRCLASIKDIADEIVVVDGGSTDSTQETAKQFGAHVIVTDNPAVFHINKQKALEACHGQWILQLDADEEVTSQLAREITETIKLNDDQIQKRHIDVNQMRLFRRHQNLLEKRDGPAGKAGTPVAAFYLSRRNYFLGHKMRYAGTYPDGVIRLVRRGKAHFPSKSVHEQIEIDGSVAWLANDLLHYSNPTMSKYWLGAKRYTGLLALNISKEKLINPLTAIDYIFVKPVYTFALLFFRHKGILDGIYGFLFCFFSALHFPVAYIKALKLRRKYVL